jgi:N6-adenosine-specific RNA methylase IME4
VKRYRTILVDPPWPLRLVGKRRDSRNPQCESNDQALPYPTMDLATLAALPVGELAMPGAHLWLWTTNQHLEDGFHLMRRWGFTYLAPITLVKPSGMGFWFVSRTQTLLMGYRERCEFRRARFRPTVLFMGNPARHSAKPECSYELIEAVSAPRRVELFARSKRPGWDVWGNEVASDLSLPLKVASCP